MSNLPRGQRLFLYAMIALSVLILAAYLLAPRYQQYQYERRVDAAMRDVNRASAELDDAIGTLSGE